MFALATVLVVVLVSLLIARVATVALALTGLTRDAARSRRAPPSPARASRRARRSRSSRTPSARRVVMLLMLIGSAGLVTVIATLMLSFTDTGGEQKALRLAILLAGLTALWFAARSTWVDRRLSWLIARILRRWTDLDTSDYGQLLHLADRYAVGEIAVREDDWVANRTLDELKLRDEGRPSPAAQLRELDRRTAGREGDRAHETAVAEHRAMVRALEREHAGDPTG